MNEKAQFDKKYERISFLHLKDFGIEMYMVPLNAKKMKILPETPSILSAGFNKLIRLM